MARIYTENISDTECIGDSLVKINTNSLNLDTAVYSISSGKSTINGNLTATDSFIALNNIRIYKSSINSWINLGDKQLTHESWVFNDQGGHIMPLNRTKANFYGTGSLQTWIVPTGVTFIYAKLWGAGGAGGAPGGWTWGSSGGGGGHTRGLIPVTPGETLTLIVGKGGIRAPGANVSSFGYGGGSTTPTNDANKYGGQGGGGSFIFRNFVNTSPQPGGSPLLVAGGGGGGGSIYLSPWGDAGANIYNDGGAGGGLTGLRGHSPISNQQTGGGGGGTQTSPGVGGSGSNHNGRPGGYDGNKYQGGTSGSQTYGGGGGGGYNGGGGGAYNGGNTMAGGGGGSGYIEPAVIFGETFTGVGRGCPYSLDPDLIEAQNNVMQYGVPFGLGYGGVYNARGYDGYIAIYY